VLEDYDPDVHIRMHGCKQIYGWDRILVDNSPPGSKLDKIVRAAVTKKDEMGIVVSNREAADRPLEFSLETNGGENGIGNGFNGSAMRDGVLNVMRHMGMISGKEIKIDKIQYLRSLGIGIHSTRGGFFTPVVDIKENVVKSQKIGEIRNFFDEVVEEIKSPADGMILGYYCEAPHIGSGQWRIFELFEPTEYR
jgi:predicted deacylase